MSPETYPLLPVSQEQLAILKTLLRMIEVEHIGHNLTAPDCAICRVVAKWYRAEARGSEE